VAVTGGNLISGLGSPSIAGNHLTLQLNTAGSSLGISPSSRLKIDGKPTASPHHGQRQ